jgi:hypothetical protein
MAKRSDGTARPKTAKTRTSSSDTTTDAVEQRVLAFAAQLGRVAGAFQAKAEGWMDRKAVKEQIASVRDGAADLLEQLAGGATKLAKQTRAGAATPASAKPPSASTRRRSGGVVDAPGKKHRPPMPSDPEANVADSQAAKVRMARTMIKTNRRRGRG